MQFETSAAQLLAILADEGIDYFFMNPGTDTAPVQEALAERRAARMERPMPVLCLHEHVALSAAIGSFMVTQKPQAVMVHVDCGTLNLGGALHNAQRNGLPAVIFAGRTPYSVTDDVPGYRDGAFQWQQEQLDQPAVVRSFGKWSMEIPRGRHLGSIVRRAFQVADAQPRGLSYVMTSREAMMEPPAPTPPKSARPTLPGPDPEALRTIAGALVNAKRPLVIAQRVGRNPGCVPVLAELSTLLKAPILDIRDYVNVPPDHSLAIPYAEGTSLIKSADAILLLDVEVPWVPGVVVPSHGARVMQIDHDCVKSSMPSWSFPIDIALTADTSLALPMLQRAVVEQLKGQRTGTWTEAEQVIKASRITVRARAGSNSPEDAADAACAAINDALPADAIVLVEAVTNEVAVARQLSRRPGSFFQVGASSLGWSVGASIGAKLAAPERPVVAICGDGSFNFSVPTAALWTARRSKTPFVTVILNNSRYAASQTPVERLFPDGTAAARRDFAETDLDPPVDYAGVARACGAEGIQVKSHEGVHDAVRQSLKRLDEGVSTVIDLVLPKPG